MKKKVQEITYLIPKCLLSNYLHSKTVATFTLMQPLDARNYSALSWLERVQDLTPNAITIVFIYSFDSARNKMVYTLRTKCFSRAAYM